MLAFLWLLMSSNNLKSHRDLKCFTTIESMLFLQMDSVNSDLSVPMF